MMHTPPNTRKLTTNMVRFSLYHSEADARDHYERLRSGCQRATERAEELARTGRQWMAVDGPRPEEWERAIANFTDDMARAWGEEAVDRLCPTRPDCHGIAPREMATATATATEGARG